MDPLHIRVDQIIDSGTVVSLIGCDIETGSPVTIHVDHRPFAAFWRAWQDAGFPQPLTYEESGCTLSLDRASELDGEAPAHG
jgi:hypothetical protein